MTSRLINGRTYTLSPIPALQSFALQPLLAPIVGRLLGLILAVVGNDDSLSLDSISISNLMAAAPNLAPELGAALGSLKPADLVTLLRGLLGGASVDVGAGIAVPLWPTSDDKRFNALFAGRTRDLWLLLWFAITENYPDFFPKALAGSGGGAAVASPSAASSTSPGGGPSTGSSQSAG